MRRSILRLLLLLAGILSILYAGFLHKTGGDTTTPSQAETKVSCYQLGQAFSLDSVAADRKYRGKTLALEGLLAGFTDDDAERFRRGESVWMWQRSTEYVALVGATREKGRLLVQAPVKWPRLSATARQQSRVDSLLWARGQVLNSTAARPYVLVQVQLMTPGLEASFPANTLPGAAVMPRWTTTFYAYEASHPVGRGLRSQLLTHRLRLNARYRRYTHRADSTLVLCFDQGDSIRAAPFP